MSRQSFGRLLLTLAAIFTAIGAVVADMSPTHVFNPAWAPHARFHGAQGVMMAILLAVIALWLLWRPAPEPEHRLRLTALITAVFWAAFFPAMAVPGTLLLYPPAEIGIALGNLIVIGLGYWLARPAGAAT
jgi:uncharacterized membrane protein